MRKIFILLFLLVYSFGFAQEQQIAAEYFKNGAYEKALIAYEKLFEHNTRNRTYFQKIIDCHQQLKQYDIAEKKLKKRYKNYPGQINLVIELGYNFQLQKNQNKAKNCYDQVFKHLKKDPYSGEVAARAFREKNLLDEAIEAYKIVSKVNPNPNFRLQIASLYGEKGEIEYMFNTYLDIIERESYYTSSILQYIGQYTTSDSENNYNILLKKCVLKRIQQEPKNAWNIVLSWLYIEQEQYDKALIQEKALYKRDAASSLAKIFNVGKIAYTNEDLETAIAAFSFIIDKSSNTDEIIEAKLYTVYTNLAQNIDVKIIEKSFLSAFKEYGYTTNMLEFQIAYADFLTFKKDDTEQAIKILEHALEIAPNEFEKGAIKLKLGDVLVFQNKFDSALIYFSQVQTKLKNHSLAQQARYKVAQTSYFKGDFEWAQTQLKVLKSSTSQLIANDALQLSLIISDNSVDDSLKIPLKLYAKADLLAYQNKNSEAINVLSAIIRNHKGHAIEDEALFKQAKLYELVNNPENAITNYQKIIEINPNDILVDDAIYNLAELFSKQNNIEKAKEYYQKIIFEHQSSIHLVAARNKYRKLRGDNI